MTFLNVPVSEDKWLENPPRRRRRSTARKSSGKRRPPKGFRTWKAYMKSIRPTSKGGTVARRRRRRRPSAAPVRRRRRRKNPSPVLANRRRRRRRNPGTAVMANPRRRRRRRSVFYRRILKRNPPRFSVRGVIGQAKEATFTAVQIVGGKVVTRVVRNYIPGGKPAAGVAMTPTQIAMELGAATAVGYLASMFLGGRVGANFMAGGFVGVIESLIKTYKVPIAADALGDDGDPNVITVPAHMGGYVREALSGYVQDGGDVNGPGLGAYGPANASGTIADDSGVFADIGI